MDITGIILLVIGGAIFLIVIGILLYIFVFSKRRYKKQIKELARKFSYLDALLVGTDSQHIHRLEIISHTNLLYVEKYEMFSKKYRNVYETEDKYAESMITQLNKLVAAGQFKNIKVVINDAKKAVANFEEKVNELDSELYSVIRLEEEARQSILEMKEEYRRAKQIYFANANDLESVSATFNKVFDKLDMNFAQIEEYIESAEYDETNNMIPTIKGVISALNNALNKLPNLCSLIHTVIPGKIKKINERYREVEKLGIPLYHLNYKIREEGWKKSLASLSKKINNLQTNGVLEECNAIQAEIEQFYLSFDQEINDEQYFKKECDEIYNKVLDLEKSFLRICSLLPEVKEIYYIDDLQNANIEEIKGSINRLGESRRILDGFIHSGTHQPYSLLKEKLESLNNDYETASTKVREFKAYIDSLRESAEEAYKMIFAYYYRTKEVENYLNQISVKALSDAHKTDIDNIFLQIDRLNDEIKKKPINIHAVVEEMEELKNFANSVFDLIEGKYREAQLAESAIVYANRDRKHQTDVHQSLNQLETLFFDGEFEKVYRDASAIFNRNHVEEHNGR